MKRKFYINEIERAKPIIAELLQWHCGTNKAKKLLEKCDIHTINTIQLLMYMGRDIVYFNIKEPEEEPIQWFISWSEHMSAYYNIDKKIETECILGKKDYQEFLSSAVKLMGILL